MFYYETVGKSYRRLLHREGFVLQVDLHPVESYAAAAPRARWLVELPRAWSLSSCCRVTELRGPLQRCAVKAKAGDKGEGCIEIKGAFPGGGGKPCAPSREPAAEASGLANFRLRLTTAVSAEDFQRGYCLTGTVERGVDGAPEMTTTHFAVVKRKGY